jgi:Fur family peroxide stress response transcriptional regulator
VVTPQGELIDTFRHFGIRLTAQRLAVAEVLINSTDHPTALQVYDRVRERLPHITLGTIYNTMSTLAEKGFIQPLLFANGTRYDTNLHSHANLVCVSCGRIVDADDKDGTVTRLREQMTTASGFQLLSQRLDFYGTCPDCLAKP